MMNKFGKYLKEYLDFKNISIKEFAYRIGTTPKNLSEIISGEIKLSSNMIYNIIFNCCSGIIINRFNIWK